MAREDIDTQLKTLAIKQQLAKYAAIWVGSISIILLVSHDIKKNVLDPDISEFCEKNNKTCHQYIGYSDADWTILFRNSSMPNSLEETYLEASIVTSVTAGLICTALAFLAERAHEAIKKSTQTTNETAPLFPKRQSKIQKFKKPLWELLELTSIIFITINVYNAIRGKIIQNAICGDFLHPEDVREYQVNPTCNHFPSSTSTDAIDALRIFSSDISKAFMQAGAIQGAEYAASFAAVVFVIFCFKKCLEPRAPEQASITTTNPTYTGYNL